MIHFETNKQKNHSDGGKTNWCLTHQLK